MNRVTTNNPLKRPLLQKTTAKPKSKRRRTEQHRVSQVNKGRKRTVEKSTKKVPQKRVKEQPSAKDWVLENKELLCMIAAQLTKVGSRKDLAALALVNKLIHAVSCFVSQKADVPLWTIKLKKVKDFKKCFQHFEQRKALPLPKMRIKIKDKLLKKVNGKNWINLESFMYQRHAAEDSEIRLYGDSSRIPKIRIPSFVNALSTGDVKEQIDLRQLKKISLGSVHVKLKLPPCVTEFQAWDVAWKVDNALDFTEAGKLTKVTLVRAYGAVTLPALVTELEVGEVLGTLDLRQAKDLKPQNCKIGKIDKFGKVLYPWGKE